MLTARDGASWLAGPASRMAGPLLAGGIWPQLAEPAPARQEQPCEPAPTPPPPLRFSEADLARLCAKAAADARQAALAELAATEARELRALEGRLAETLHGLTQALQARRAEMLHEAVAIGGELGRLIGREALRGDPMAVAEAVATEFLAELRDEPEVTVEVPAAQADELRARLDAIAGTGSPATKIVLRSVPGLRPGELRVLWRDGWAERLLDTLEARAAAALAALAGMPADGTAGIDTITLGDTGK